MSTMNPYLKQYKKNEVETASPEQILILLYNGAINFLNKAKVCLEENDDEQFHLNMLRCKNIIIEFMDTLDLEQGGQWALTLFNLYKYLRKLTIKSDISKDEKGIDEIQNHLVALRDTWLKAIEIAKDEKKQQSPENEGQSSTTRNSADYYDNEDRYESSEDNDDEDDDEEEDDEELDD